MAVAEPSAREGRLTSADGTQLFWRAWEIDHPRASFACVHGLGEHSGRYERFARAMAARGFSTFAVDLRGMGKSGGARGLVNSWSEWVKDAETFVGHVEEHASAGEVVPVGHSFGGVVVLSAVLHENLQPRRFVLSNPALRPKVAVPAWKVSVGRAASRWMPALTLSNEVDAAAVSRDPEVVRAYTADPLVHDQISARLYTEWLQAADEVQRRAADIRVPFYLSLGDADRLIDHTASLEFAEHAVNAHPTVRVWPGRYHEPFNDLDADEVFDGIAGWVTAA